MQVVVSAMLNVVLLTILAVQTGESIHCYKCNSKTDSWCEDPFVQSSAKPSVDCSTPTDGYNLTYTRCLKMNQNVNGETRVIRDCATADPTAASTSGCLSRTGTASVKVTYCQCVGEECNAAANVRPSSAFAAAVSVGAVVMLALLR